MLIQEAIDRIKACSTGISFETGEPLRDETTRDQVTYGCCDQPCTGIVTCIWPTVGVIEQARERGANLIISHEALFWNHGDHQEPLADNAAFKSKRALLDAWGGAVWRFHDYIHAGVPIDAGGAMADGIFFGLAHKLGWLEYRVGDAKGCLDYQIPPTRARDLARQLVERLGLNGTRVLGDANALVSRVRIPLHVLGNPQKDTALINALDAGEVDALVAMELVDFTVAEYLRDAAQMGAGKCAIAIGHFNVEEPGMEYAAAWLPRILGAELPVSFVAVGDPCAYVGI